MAVPSVHDRNTRFATRWNRLFLSLAILSCLCLAPGVEAAEGPIIFVAFDGLHPYHLGLSANGLGKGAAGDWLMPNLRTFIDNRCVWFTSAKAHLPAVTDMNHLNALAGTNSGQTGFLWVEKQMTGWDANGEPVFSPMSAAITRDDRGRPVETLFHLYKKRFPGRETAFISGKEWVPQGYPAEAVDHAVTGGSAAIYGLPAPGVYSLYDPATDLDGPVDPESEPQKVSSAVRMITLGPETHPNDAWIVQSTLRLLKDRPAIGMAYILLAQPDASGHNVGVGWNLWEFSVLPKLSQLYPNVFRYQLASRRNPEMYREPMLDTIRDTDAQFGLLVQGLRDLGILDTATIVLLSDHSMENYLNAPRGYAPPETDVMGILRNARVVGEGDAAIMAGGSLALLYWREGKERVQAAKAALLNHRAVNPLTGNVECPWEVLDRIDMKYGKVNVALPGELYHRYFVEIDREATMKWPDLIVIGKNGWQIPTYEGAIRSDLGDAVPRNLFLGGHGSVETLPILMAFGIPGVAPHASARDARISDIAVTLAGRYGFAFGSTTVGQDLSPEFQAQP